MGDHIDSAKEQFDASLKRLRGRRAASAPQPKAMNNIDATRELLRRALRFAGSSADETVAEALAQAIEAFVDAKLDDVRAEIDGRGIHDPDW